MDNARDHLSGRVLCSGLPILVFVEIDMGGLEKILDLLREVRLDVQEANAKPMNIYFLYCPSCDKEYAECVCEAGGMEGPSANRDRE